MRNLFLGLAILSLMSSCATTKLKLAKVDPQDIEFSLSRGACYGTCPVYLMNIFGDGRAEFNGERNIEKRGKYTKQIDPNIIQELKEAVASADIHQFQDVYESDIADLPMVKMGFVDSKGFKSIKGKNQLPEKVVDLEKLLTRIANSDGWTRADQSTEAGEEEPEPDYIKSQIIIEPKPGVLLPKWFNEMKDAYGVRLMKRVSNETNLWLISYDKSKAGADEMLEILKNDDSILHAEFNKKVEMR